MLEDVTYGDKLLVADMMGVGTLIRGDRREESHIC